MTNFPQYSEYSKIVPSVGSVKPTVPSAQVSTNKGVSEAVTAQAGQPAEQKILGREERIEYRDQDGKLLNEEEVASLMAEGKASFSTKYETETRLVDEAGNLIPNQSGVAPDHPDAEGVNPDTKGQSKASREPADADVSLDDSREEHLKKPKPASDASEATK